MAIEHIIWPGGPEAKINATIDAANIITGIRGDDRFIKIDSIPDGVMVSLNLQAVLARVPHLDHAPILAKLTVDSGGDGVNYPTYTAKSWDGTITYGTKIVVLGNRWPVDILKAATYGYLSRDPRGAGGSGSGGSTNNGWVVFSMDCDEIMTDVVCTDTGSGSGS